MVHVQSLVHRNALARFDLVDGYHAVGFQRQRVEGGAHGQHVGLHVVAHQVKAEGVHFVLRRPRHQRINHEFFHHVV
jgi:hypothetical protein